MIAVNIVLMIAVIVGIVSLLAWAIVSDRLSERSAGSEIAPEVAPLHRNLEMPRELRTHSGAHTRPTRGRPAPARPAHSHRDAARSTLA